MNAPSRDPSANAAAERVVIGSVLVKPDLFFEIDLRVDEFKNADARSIWNAIADEIYNGKGIVDPISLSARLKGALSSADIASFKKDAADSTKLSFCAERIRDAAIDGDVRSAAREILASEERGFDLLAVGQQRFIELGSRDTQNDSVPIKDVAHEVRDEARKRRGGELKDTEQVLSGLPPLDEYMSTKRGGMITIAGRPSMGKSALRRYLSALFIERDERILTFSTESTKEEEATAFLALKTGISSHRIGAKPLSTAELQKLDEADSIISTWPLWIDDQRRELPKLCREIRKMKAREKITMVVVDHLQELGTGERRPGDVRQDLNRVLAGLRSVCRESPKCTLVLCSQLSRTVEGRDDKRPMLSDLKESGTIEEMSDMVFLLYRPCYYQHNADRRLLEVLCGKNRNGKTGKMDFDWEYELGQVGGVRDDFEALWTVSGRRVMRDGVEVASTGGVQ